MKTILSILLLFLFSTFTTAQVKSTWNTKAVPKTNTSTYNATNIKTSNTTKYYNKNKNIAKAVPTSYATLTKSSRDLPKEAYAKLESVKSKGISSFSFNKNGGWAIVTKNGEVYTYKISSSLQSKINWLKKYNRKVKQIVFNPNKNDSWVIVTENSAYSNRIPRDLNTALQSFLRKKKKIQSVSFGDKTNNTWVVVNTDGSFAASKIPDECYLTLKNLYKINNPKARVKNVAFLSDNEWAVMADGGLLLVSRSLGKNAKDVYRHLVDNMNKSYLTEVIAVSPGGKSWSMVANSKTAKLSNKRDVYTKARTFRKSNELQKNSYTSGDGNKENRFWKLKVTLAYFYNDEAGDSDDMDDYILNQWVEFTDGSGKQIDKIKGYMNKKMAPKNSSINRGIVKDRRVEQVQLPGNQRFVKGNNILFVSDEANQLRVKEGQNNRKKIGNFLIFEISQKVLFHKRSQFIMVSLLGESTFNQSIGFNVSEARSVRGYGNINMSATDVKIDLKSLITDLTSLDKIRPKQWTKKYANDLEMRKYNATSKDLYGYIHFRDEEKDRKAKALMRFEFIK